MRENLKHKILSLESTAGSEWEEDASSQRLTSISKEQLFQMLQKARGRYHKYKGRYSDLVKGYQVKTFVKRFVLPQPWDLTFFSIIHILCRGLQLKKRQNIALKISFLSGP